MDNQIPIPDQKPKWKQFTFWLPIVTPLINVAIIMFAANYPDLADVLKRTGLLDALLIAIGGSSLTSAAYIHGEKSKDKSILTAMVNNSSSVQPVPAVIETTLPSQPSQPTGETYLDAANGE